MYIKNKLTYVFILWLLSLLLFSCNSIKNTPDAIDLHDNAVYFSNYHGKWILINYWASWCKPCIEEIPVLNTFYQQHRDRDAMVFGVNYDFVDKTKLIELTRKVGIKFPVLLGNPGKKFGIISVDSLPTILLINPEGKLIAELHGAQTKEKLTHSINIALKKE